MTTTPGPLFEALRIEFDRAASRRHQDAQRDLLHFDLEEGTELARAICANVSRGGFCTFVVPGSESWDPASYYYEAVREAARAGKDIHRAFLLPMRAGRRSALLGEHVRLDREAGIKVSVLYVGRLISTTAVPFAENLDIGIWDDEVTCLAAATETDGRTVRTGWRLSKRREHLQAATSLRDQLLTKAEPLSLEHTGSEVVELEEPMLITARLAAELAPVLCKGGHVSSEDCSWYHGVWQYLRIFDMVSTPTWHSDFYLSTVNELGRRGFSRVLVSGTADYSTLAHVLKAYQGTNITPLITVVDLCETPLLLCRWYSRYYGVPIEVNPEDIFKFVPEVPFDIVVTDAFLTRFDSQDQRRLVQTWARLLRPGGTVVTTVRIEPGRSGLIARASSDQATAFRRRAFREAQKWRGALDRPSEEIASMAQSYAERMVSHSIGSLDELVAIFREAGFTVEAKLAEVPGEMASTSYARVVASKHEIAAAQARM